MQPATKSSLARQLAVVFLLALGIRGAFLGVRFDQLAADPDGYRQIATELRTTGQFARRDGTGPAFRTAYRPPLYPLMLAVAGPNPMNVAVLHALWGAATAAGVFALARGLGQGLGAWIAAGFVALDPLLLNQSSLVMTETLAALLTLLAVGLLTWWSAQPSWPRAMMAGAAMGLCILCRPTYLVWLPLIAAMLLYPGWKVTKTWQELGLLLAAIVTVLPWTVRNTLVFGTPISTTTHGGYTLLLGNNPHFYAFARQGDWSQAWEAQAFHAAWRERRTPVDSPQGELAEEALAYRWSRESIRNEPGSCAIACLYRWRQLLNPLPNRLAAEESRSQMLARYAVAAWYLLVYAAALWGLPWWRGTTARRSAGSFSLALLIVFLAIHTFYWTDLRMRAPLMPLLQPSPPPRAWNDHVGQASCRP